MLHGPAFAGRFPASDSFAAKRDAVAAIFERLDRGVCATCRARIFEECRRLPPPADPT
jgi:SulP family sulfate permease